MGNLIDGFLKLCAGAYPAGLYIRGLVMGFISIFSIHKTVYFLLGIFFTRKFPPAKKQHKYAILIPARNEEAVIGNLIASISRQDYPSELITVFVIADNCTDNTAARARECGAVCYERFDDLHRTKGFALQFLFEKIDRDYGIEAFEGYFIFDADNLLKRDYISRMNESFDAGEKIITSYRNTKNFDENWVASTYAIHWLRSIRTRHRARSVLGLATNIQGTGFLFSNELVKDGWKYTSLTEDRAFTADAVSEGYMISYNDAAMFYDEQPTSIKIAMRQRIRWAKGHQQAFVESGPQLFKNILAGAPKTEETGDMALWKRIFYDLRHRFASFDTLGQLIPTPLFDMFFFLTVNLFLRFCSAYANGLEEVRLFSKGGYIARILRLCFGDIYLNMGPGLKTMLLTIIIILFGRICSRLWSYIRNIPIAMYVFVTEHRRIKKMPIHKMLLYCLTWPVFDSLHRYSMYIALFMKVEWKQIPHQSKVKIEDLDESGNDDK